MKEYRDIAEVIADRVLDIVEDGENLDLENWEPDEVARSIAAQSIKVCCKYGYAREEAKEIVERARLLVRNAVISREIAQLVPRKLRSTTFVELKEKLDELKYDAEDIANIDDPLPLQEQDLLCGNMPSFDDSGHLRKSNVRMISRI